MSVVYFIQSGKRGPIKIGVASSVARRIKSLQVGNPHRLILMATVPGGYELEGELHARFGCGRIADEWFEVDTPGLMETVEHILRHGVLPTPPVVDDSDIGATCGTCGWPMSAELEERGERRCWTCLTEARK